jgi:hypothetical protein
MPGSGTGKVDLDDLAVGYAVLVGDSNSSAAPKYSGKGPVATEAQVPMLYNHCESVYNALRDRAIAVPLSGEGLDGKHMLVYEGFTTRLFKEVLHLSVPYYTYSLRALRQMGCIRMLKRGGGSAPSQWELIKEPTMEAFEAQSQQTVSAGKDGNEKASAETARMDALQAQVQELSKTVDQVLLFLQEQFGREKAADVSNEEGASNG